MALNLRTLGNGLGHAINMNRFNAVVQQQQAKTFGQLGRAARVNSYTRPLRFPKLNVSAPANPLAREGK